MNMAQRSLEDRFWSFVSPEPNSGCWLWSGSQTKGYGMIGIDGSTTYATHIALLLHGRPRPTHKAIACHTCDVTFCVNPDHLYWGTPSQNQKDALTRNRKTMMPPTHGEANYSAKLTDAMVREIRGDVGSRTALAKRMGVCIKTINNVRRRVAWKHVE